METVGITNAKIALHLLFRELRIECTILDQNNMKELIVHAPLENIVFFLEDDIIVIHVCKHENTCVGFRMTSGKMPIMVERYLRRILPTHTLKMCVHPSVHNGSERELTDNDWVWVVLFVVFTTQFHGQIQTIEGNLLEINHEAFLVNMKSILDALKEYSSLKIHLSKKKELTMITKKYFDKVATAAKNDKQMLSVMVFDKLNKTLENMDALQFKRYLKVSSNMFDTLLHRKEAALEFSMYNHDIEVDFLHSLIEEVKKGALYHYDYVLSYIPKLQKTVSGKWYHSSKKQMDFSDCVSHFASRKTEMQKLTLSTLNEIVVCLLKTNTETVS